MMAAFLLLFGIIIATVVAVYWDYRVYSKWFRGILIAFSGLMLVGFIMEPDWWSVQGSEYALLTEGWRNSDVNISGYEKAFTVEQKSLSDRSRAENLKWLPSASFLKNYLPEGSRVTIYGFGTDEILSSNYRWTDKMESPPAGIKLNYAPSQAEIGREFEIFLALHPAPENDSIAVIKDGALLGYKYSDANGKISVSDRLDMPGPASYQFEWLYGDSLISERWNIRGIETDQLMIGALLYSPSFEINYLSNHFGSRGHQFVKRIRIGDDRFRFDAINAARPGDNSIQNAYKDLDLLILDPREYLEFSSDDKAQLANAIENGLDLLLTTPTEENIVDWLEVIRELSGLDVDHVVLDRIEERGWIPREAESTPAELIPLNLLNTNFTSIPDDAEVLGTWTDSEPVSIRLRNERGSISANLFYQTYRWLLGGHVSVYNRFWSDYLGDIITREADQINMAPLIPRKDREMIITTTSASNGTELQATAMQSRETFSVPVSSMTDHPVGSFARFWPLTTGWHRMIYGDEMKWSFVYDQDWVFDRKIRTYLTTKQQIVGQEQRTDFTGQTNNEKVPDWVWLLSFLMFQGMLWAERKW